MLKVLNCVALEHDLRLVALSAVICILGCVTTVTLLGRAQEGRHRSEWWTVAAAIIFGCSIWSLHFVAMMAFMPGLPITYDIGLTALSIAVPVGGSWVAFCVFGMRGPRSVRIILAGLLLGATIAGMHYVGVMAMRLPGFLLFDTQAIVASIVLAVVFSILALARGSDLSHSGKRFEVSVWLAVGICGLHFTGMSAVTIVPGTAHDGGGVVLASASLAIAVGAISLAILMASLAALMMQQHLSQRVVQELARMRLLSNLSQEVLMILRDGTILEVNSAGERMFGRLAAELIGRRIASLLTQASAPAMYRRLKTRCEDLQPEEMNVQTADGAHVTVEVTCQAITYLGQPATAMAFRDLTARKYDEARIRHLARHDALTDLPNRYTLNERLEMALAAAAHDHTDVAVLYFDFDRFKPVNDSFGHAVGDALLVRASKRILAELGGTDMLARVGGDEFVVVVSSIAEPKKVAALAQRIIATLSRPFQIEGHRLQIGVSAGLALYPNDGTTSDALLRAADTAMYRVKDEGRGALRFFEPSMDAQLQARRRLEQELGGALEAGELTLHYQPIVNGANGEVETFEALIRWNHPERGLVPPVEFIPFAEETGLIGPIGAWVIDAACAAASQ